MESNREGCLESISMQLRAGEAHCFYAELGGVRGGRVWGKGTYGSATEILTPLNCGHVYAAVGTGSAPARGGGGSLGSIGEVKRRQDTGMSCAGRVG